MSIVLSSSSDSVDKAIDEYSNRSRFSGSSDSDSSSGSSSGGEHYGRVHIWCPWGSFRGSPGRAIDEV